MPKKLPGYVNEEEFLRIIKEVKKKHHKLAFILAFSSGLRISEIVNLKESDIDINGKKIFIRAGKGDKDRVTPLPKGFLKSYMDHIPLKCKQRALQRAFKRYIIKAKIIKDNLHFHSLRHSFAVRCMEQGLTLNQIQVLLGHSSIKTTSIYLQINPKEALESYERKF